MRHYIIVINYYLKQLKLFRATAEKQVVQLSRIGSKKYILYITSNYNILYFGRTNRHKRNNSPNVKTLYYEHIVNYKLYC